MVFQPRDQNGEWDDDGIIGRLGEYEWGYELVLVNIIRDAINNWSAEDYPGVTRTTSCSTDVVPNSRNRSSR